MAKKKEVVIIPNDLAIGTHFILNEVEYVVRKAKKKIGFNGIELELGSCEGCAWESLDCCPCDFLDCDGISRKDKTHVVYKLVVEKKE